MAQPPASKFFNGVAVIINPRQLADFMRSPEGPVYRKMATDAAKVKAEAKRLVGVFHSPDSYTMSNRSRAPGTLRDSIVTRIVIRGGVPDWQVGSADPIALIHHEGIPGGVIITPKTKPFLVFYWPKVGRVVRARQVTQGAIKPNRYLTNALKVIQGGH